MPRIVSVLPAGTEIAFALGAGDEVVGRSHECDYPPQVRSLPVVSRPALSLEGLSQEEIDRAVAERLRSGGSLYEVDEVLLRELSADVVLTQDLCQVCAPSGTELTRALRDLPTAPQVLWLTPQNIGQIEENIRAVGDATGRADAARAVIARNHERIAAVERAVAGEVPRRVVFLEWTEPLFCAGHWVPEMITIAGGVDPFGRPSADSQRMEWEAVVAARPEFILVAPCGYDLEAAFEMATRLPRIAGTRIVALDANAYFARPGPRVAEGIELLASVLHPRHAPWRHSHVAAREVPSGA